MSNIYLTSGRRTIFCEKFMKRLVENIREKSKNLTFNEGKFRKFVDEITDRNWISSDQKNEILTSLHDQEVQKLIRLFFRFNILSIGIGTSSAFFNGGALAVSKSLKLAGKSLLVFEALTMISKNIFVRIQGKGIPNVGRLANVSMIPFVGEFAPIARLFKSHPEFTKVLIGYKMSQKSMDQEKFIRGYNRIDKINRFSKNVKEKVSRVLSPIMFWKKRTSDRVQSVLEKDTSLATA